MKIFLTKEQAISILPDGDSIHTFYNPGFGLVGADWSREELLDELGKRAVRELTGPSARGMGHGLCTYDKTAKKQSEILFIETDEAKLEALEKKIAVASEDCAQQDTGCMGCQYHGIQHQKCSCCTRNHNLKDCYTAMPEPPIDPCFIALGFEKRPESVEEVKARWAQYSKACHPDAGGNVLEYADLVRRYRTCLMLMGEKDYRNAL